LSQARSKKLGVNQAKNNSVDDWKIKSIDPTQIDTHNRDVIICKAVKV